MIASIHQPNFFPWMGFFDKLNRSDSFVFLTSSLRSKTDRYLTRTRIVNNSTARYISIPLGIKQVPINQLLMPVDNKWKIKSLNVIHAAYSNSNYYEEVIPKIEELFMQDSQYFSDYSISIIKYLVSKFHINTRIYIDTDFSVDFGTSNERNIAICKEIDAEGYLSGDGAKIYNDSELFESNNINLDYQNYIQSSYSQKTSEFIAGLSIIDVIFNCGYEETERMLKNNEKS